VMGAQGSAAAGRAQGFTESLGEGMSTVGEAVQFGCCSGARDAKRGSRLSQPRFLPDGRATFSFPQLGAFRGVVRLEEEEESESTSEVSLLDDDDDVPRLDAAPGEVVEFSAGRDTSMTTQLDMSQQQWGVLGTTLSGEDLCPGTLRRASSEPVDEFKTSRNLLLETKRGRTVDEHGIPSAAHCDTRSTGMTEAWAGIRDTTASSIAPRSTGMTEAWANMRDTQASGTTFTVCSTQNTVFWEGLGPCDSAPTSPEMEPASAPDQKARAMPSLNLNGRAATGSSTRTGTMSSLQSGYSQLSVGDFQHKLSYHASSASEDDVPRVAR